MHRNREVSMALNPFQGLKHALELFPEIDFASQWP